MGPTEVLIDTSDYARANFPITCLPKFCHVTTLSGLGGVHDWWMQFYRAIRDEIGSKNTLELELEFF